MVYLFKLFWFPIKCNTLDTPENVFFHVFVFAFFCVHVGGLTSFATVPGTGTAFRRSLSHFIDFMRNLSTPVVIDQTLFSTDSDLATLFKEFLFLIRRNSLLISNRSLLSRVFTKRKINSLLSLER